MRSFFTLSFVAYCVMTPYALANTEDHPRPKPVEDVYIGIQAGQSSVDWDVLNQYQSQGANIDETAFAYKLYTGYRYKNAAIEFGYSDLGTIDGKVPGINAEAEADTYSLSAIGFMPINNELSFHAKFGFHAWDYTERAHWSNTFAEGSARYSDSGKDPVYGIGAMYELGKYRFRLEAERYDIDKADIDFISAGFAYKF
ncbi:outer membrane beta-barrel protein [Salinivibrio sp. ES.052]|uniref:outer membrane beta-barrel protein n=1 Tax=Salinivibrio sp. ES.052 TaxID=1882823 RepID=UPI00092A3191|nr:outer membrane beta-barrel protein [Salinivibrio sp. ES.052]SIN79890.1 OmpA-like transmembrane domain-containing protein [Salinivibrio sp. ES.052]